MQELTEQQRLEAALAGGDTEAIRAAARALLVRSEAAEALLQRAGRLVDLGLQAASMVHELRQPLSGIKAFAQLIERAHAGSPTEEKAASIVRHAEAMEAICARLRAYARGEPQQRQAGDVNTAVAAALELLRFDLRKAGLTVETDLAGDLPPVGLGATPLQQILVNLLRNAREALGARPGHVRITTAAADDEVRATVADDGPGVPAELRPRLFQPFATSGKEDGLGLGLYLSRRLAQEAGGGLTLLPTDHGAAFRLSLPRLDDAGEGR
jgi:two-component system NtrC family sensor kinase